MFSSLGENFCIIDMKYKELNMEDKLFMCKSRGDCKHGLAESARNSM